ncbi:hypothetical protein JW898_05940 [Candidatus Woesearchaeota archaeon]|nr:hypothetical protein [Candidatus Woesearchaeota archaeon]
MVSEAFITNTVTIIVLAILIGTFALPKKIRYAVHALFLLSLGLLPILYALDVIGFTFGEAGIIKYMVSVVVVFTARSLIVEGVNEEGPMRWASIIAGVVIIMLVSVPALHSMGALTFTIPKYPALIDHILYVIASVLVILGIFMSHE